MVVCVSCKVPNIEYRLLIKNKLTAFQLITVVVLGTTLTLLLNSIQLSHAHTRLAPYCSEINIKLHMSGRTSPHPPPVHHEVMRYP